MTKGERKNLMLMRRVEKCLTAKSHIFNLKRKKSVIPMIKACKKFKYFQDTVRMNMLQVCNKESLGSYKNEFIKNEKKKAKGVSFFLEHEHKHRCTLCYPAKYFPNVNNIFIFSGEVFERTHPRPLSIHGDVLSSP